MQICDACRTRPATVGCLCGPCNTAMADAIIAALNQGETDQ